ncbi:phosphoribosyltransferase family protein [Gordonia sp. CPCC 205333]|uniref:phosphoribosyltransferase family protein n=1 Tax=Gordonia sp. CPCC 205333 TaxID=3140790 RepID=UPI003AF36B8B
MSSSSPQWTERNLGLSVSDAAGDSSWHATELVIPGLRRNPRRAHLLVSTVLGKHIPTDPRKVRAAAESLGDLVADALGRLAPSVDADAATIFGFAETATGLGHGVAAHLRSHCYLQSTRRTGPDVDVVGEFTEGHSHATRHLIQPTSAELFADTNVPLVLVDDEISTGATAIDAIHSLHAIAPHPAYVVASLVDMRTADNRAENSVAAAELGVAIEFVALAAGSVTLPAELPTAVAALEAAPLNPVASQPGSVDFRYLDWPTDIPDGGRFGFLADDYDRFNAAVYDATALIDTRLHGGDVVVVGHEELMYLPQRIAEALITGGRDVRYQTTTRSPAVVLDADGYPLRRGFEFIAPEADPTARRYLYNATHKHDEPSQIVLVVDTPADSDELRGPGGLLDVLTQAGHDVLVVVVPTPTQAGLRAARAHVKAGR